MQTPDWAVRWSRLGAKNWSMIRSRTVLAVPQEQPGDMAPRSTSIRWQLHPAHPASLCLCSQASPAPSQPSSHGNYTLPKPIHHGLAIFYQHLSPDNLTPAVTA